MTGGDRDGGIIGVSQIAPDITELKKARQEREALLGSERAAREEADAAQQAAEAARQAAEATSYAIHSLRSYWQDSSFKTQRA
jgi:hypothetical protein